MADTELTTALLVLAQEYRHDIIRQVQRETVALKHVRIVPGYGLNSPIAVELDGANAETYAEGADVANLTSDKQTKGTLQWGLYRGNMHVSQHAMDTSGSTSTPGGNVRLWARQIRNSYLAVSKKVNQDLFNGAGWDGSTAVLAGLETWLGSTTANVGGIDRSSSTNALFRPYVVDPGSLTAISLDLIRTDLQTIFINSGMRPDLAIVSPNVFRKVVALFEATRRYVTSTADVNGKQVLNSGYQDVEVDGCRFVEDPDAVESTIYYINTTYWELEALVAGEVPDIGGAEMSGVEGVPLMMRIAVLAKNGQSSRASSYITLQQQYRRPNSGGVRRNVAIV